MECLTVKSVAHPRPWSGTRALEAVRSRKRAGLSMRSKDVERGDRSLYQATVRYFHGWNPATEKARITC